MYLNFDKQDNTLIVYLIGELDHHSAEEVRVKIDDRIDNLKGAKTKILYTAYHNKDISDKELMKKKIIRANNWNDIKNILVSK